MFRRPRCTSSKVTSSKYTSIVDLGVTFHRSTKRGPADDPSRAHMFTQKILPLATHLIVYEGSDLVLETSLTLVINVRLIKRSAHNVPDIQRTLLRQPGYRWVLLYSTIPTPISAIPAIKKDLVRHSKLSFMHLRSCTGTDPCRVRVLRMFQDGPEGFVFDIYMSLSKRRAFNFANSSFMQFEDPFSHPLHCLCR